MKFNSYWNMMTEKRFELYYLDQHFENCVKRNRILSIFLAFASSGAIAGWAIWEPLRILWAIIVAASQVIIVANEYLPYKKRIKQIRELKNKLMPIYIDIESNWSKVKGAKPDDSEVNKLHYDLVKRWEAAMAEFFADDCLPDNSAFMREAEEQKEKYMKNVFGVKAKEDNVKTAVYMMNNLLESKPMSEEFKLDLKTVKSILEDKPLNEKINAGIEAIRSLMESKQMDEELKVHVGNVRDILENETVSKMLTPEIMTAVRTGGMKRGKSVKVMNFPMQSSVPLMPED